MKELCYSNIFRWKVLTVSFNYRVDCLFWNDLLSKNSTSSTTFHHRCELPHRKCWSGDDGKWGKEGKMIWFFPSFLQWLQWWDNMILRWLIICSLFKEKFLVRYDAVTQQTGEVTSRSANVILSANFSLLRGKFWLILKDLQAKFL